MNQIQPPSNFPLPPNYQSQKPQMFTPSSERKPEITHKFSNSIDFKERNTFR